MSLMAMSHVEICAVFGIEQEMPRRDMLSFVEIYAVNSAAHPPTPIILMLQAATLKLRSVPKELKRNLLMATNSIKIPSQYTVYI